MRPPGTTRRVRHNSSLVSSPSALRHRRRGSQSERTRDRGFTPAYTYDPAINVERQHELDGEHSRGREACAASHPLGNGRPPCALAPPPDTQHLRYSVCRRERPVLSLYNDRRSSARTESSQPIGSAAARAPAERSGRFFRHVREDVEAQHVVHKLFDRFPYPAVSSATPRSPVVESSSP